MQAVLSSRIEEFLASRDKQETMPLVKSLVNHSIPKPPKLPKSMHVHEKIVKIQSYVSALSYNYISDPFWNIRKSYTVIKLTELATEMIEFGLPIKCLEAVVLAINLTSGLSGVDRIPLSFKSIFEGQCYRHIVLVLRFEGKFGAIGLSRRPDLMGKPFAFNSLAAIVQKYRDCYKKNFHKLERITIGKIVPHQKTLNQPLIWKYSNINIADRDWDLVAADIGQHQRSMSR